MEIRSVDTDTRTLVGVVAPYDEVSYLVPDPGGERIMRGAFNRSIDHRADKIPLHDNHGTNRRLGISRQFTDDDAGLVGMFGVFDGDRGDTFLTELRQGYFGGMSVGFQPLVVTRAQDGVREVREAKLIEVSVVGMPAYEGAGIMAVRNAQDLDDLLAPFRNPPVVNLDPIPQLWKG
jgi:Escherichia/Staphylococcus phage prohead protease